MRLTAIQLKISFAAGRDARRFSGKLTIFRARQGTILRKIRCAAGVEKHFFAKNSLCGGRGKVRFCGESALRRARDGAVQKKIYCVAGAEKHFFAENPPFFGGGAA